MGRLLMFYGTECEPCHSMFPLVDKLKQELGIEVEKKEIWHDSENAKLFKELDDGSCGGVPFFFNENNKKTICGVVDFEKLKEWAQ